MPLIRDSKAIVQPWVLPVIVFITMLLISWHRWTSLIVDVGRELDLPQRLMNGDWLYRDVHYPYTPFSPYFNSLLYRIFGVHSDVIALSGLAWSILLVFLCYRILRRLMPAINSALGTCVIILLCVFKPAGSLMLPYSFGALHGTVFSIASVLFLMRHAGNRKVYDLIIAGTLIGLAGLAKQEFAFAGAVTVVAYLACLHRTRIRDLARDLALAGGASMVVAGPVIAVLFSTMDWQMLINDCHLFYTNIPPSLVHYNRFRSGLNDPLSSVIQMVGAVGVSGAVICAVAFLSYRQTRPRQISAGLFVFFTGLAALVAFFSVGQWDGSPIRALPVLLVGLVAVAWRRVGADEDDSSRLSNIFVFIAAVNALVIIARVILRVPSGGFSGSFFLPVGLCMITYGLLSELPRFIGKSAGSENSAGIARSIARWFLILVILGTVVSFGYRFRAKYVHEIVTGRGTFFVEKNSGPVIGDVLQFIKANTGPDDFIAVVPEGNDLAYLSERRINLRHQVLLPDFLNEQDERDAVEMLDRDNVRYIFMTNRPMREFGYLAFGRDFNQTLGTWIEENYRVVKVFGVSEGEVPEIGDPRFFVKVYERVK